MKPKSVLSAALASLLLSIAVPVWAQKSSGNNDKANPPSDNYPLKTCVVSDEPLGSMGDSIVYMHREAGKPDREVRFCCEGCIEDFKADPAKFLKKLDAAAKTKSAPGKKTTSSGRSQHDHGA